MSKLKTDGRSLLPCVDICVVYPIFCQLGLSLSRLWIFFESGWLAAHAAWGVSREPWFLSLALGLVMCPYAAAGSLTDQQAARPVDRAHAPRTASSRSGCSFFAKMIRDAGMDGYVFYTLPASASGRAFSPATLLQTRSP